MAKATTAQALLALAILCVGATARTVPHAGSLWSHLIRSLAPTSRPQPVHKPIVQGYAVWNEQTKSLAFGAQAPENGAAPAYANYSHFSAHKSGFGQLRLETNAAYSNDVQMQAAGFIEGYLTAVDIFNHWYNQRWWLASKTNDTYKIYGWLEEHHKWMQQQLAAPANKDSPFWQAMQLVMAQVDGMLAGYNARVSVEGKALGIDFIAMREWLALNTMGDMDDLLEILFPDDPELGLSNLHNMEPAALRARLETRGRCSVLVKVTPDLSDLLIGHATWWTYTSMTRIYKHYTFNLHGGQYKTRTTSMSSYPGMVTSMDDFYILDSHLVVTETSNGILDSQLWRQVTPQAALSWQRVLAANWLSSTGADWAHWVQQHNSGTYNNQYIIVDLKVFSPGSELQEGLLTIVEQMPGLVVAADKTQSLERGYWPSYNIPYFIEVYNKSGYPAFSDRLRSAEGGEAYQGVVSGISYQLAPRAKISRRDQGSVLTMEQLKAYMRSNHWTSEPYSGNSPFGAICSRGDLDPTHPKASGCNDAKVTSYSLAMANIAEAVAGPTAGDGGVLGAFKWEQWPNVAHRGQPDVFDFTFEQQKP